MRLKKRGGLAASERFTRISGHVNPDKKAGPVQSAPVSARKEQPAVVRTNEPKVLRRQDYADIYQVGRRASAPQKAQSRIGRPQGAGMNAGAAVVLSGAPARRLRLANPKPLIIMAGVALLISAAVLGVLTMTQSPALAKGEQVIFDGRMLCIVKSRDVAEKALSQIQNDLKTTYGMDIQQSGELTYAPVSCDSQNIVGEEDAKKALKANIDVKVMASVIKVNDRPAVALQTADEAQQALDTVLNPFKNAPADRYRTDVSFVENVQIAQMPIDYSLVTEKDDAVRALTLGTGVEDNFYTVKKGDSLARVAKKNNVKVSDLKKANPALSINDVIQPGQTLNAVKPVNWVNVRYTETITRQEALPFETVEQPDATLYTTQKKTQTEGKNGQREVIAKITFINGMEATKEILSQTVIEAAQNQVVLRGTKKVPTNAGSSAGGSTSAGHFTLPVRNYTLTSTFRVRTLGGVTRWHYGVDLAAPKGTPIYASRAGTVNFAGSSSGYGLLVKISHGGGVETRYGHCSKLLVTKGQEVSKGQLIALVGSTGHSTGPHCHFEVRINGTPVDPLK